MKSYDKYKDSGIEWIDGIPEHWEVKKLKYFSNIIMGQSPDSSECNKNGIGTPFLQGNAEFGKRNPIEQNWCTNPNKIAQKNDILLSVRAPIAAVNIANKEFGIGRGLCAIRNKMPNYQYYLALSLFDELNSLGTGSTFKAISIEQIQNVKIPIPPLSEQKAIADYLDRKTSEIDELIAYKKRLLDLYEEEKTAIINQAVTKGINPNAKMKDSGIEWLGEIPEHWEVKRFDFLFSFSRGLSITKDNLNTVGIPCISYGEIHSKCKFEVKPEVDNLKCVDEGYIETSPKSLMYSADFVFADTSEDIEGSGNFSYLNSSTPIFAGYHTIIARLKNKSDCNARFFAYFFESQPFRNQIRYKVTGIKVYSITQQILKYTNLTFPLLNEQIKIVKYIDNELLTINSKIEKIKILIKLLEEYKKSLITEVSTGKVKVF